MIKAGRVRVNRAIQRDPERPINLKLDQIEVDGTAVSGTPKAYVMVNKPRGLVTTTVDEKGRDTIFACLDSSANIPGASLPRVFPVGRLDKASEGLLLLTNDTAWAARISDPESHLDKTYHVQIDCLADETLLRQMQAGTPADGDFLQVKRVSIIRHGEKNSWIEVVLDEGKNRHIRRLLAALGIEVLRLVRVAIGPLQLGTLAKGEFRHLTEAEVKVLAGDLR